jgi:hypothetical protein
MSKYIKIVLGILILILIATGLIVWLNRPVNTKITIKSSAGFKATVEEPTQIDTAYFYTLLPPGFKIDSNKENERGSQLIQISSSLTNHNDGHLSITVGMLPVEGLRGLSDYSYRIKTPINYTNIQYAGLPQEATSFFSNKGDNEITVFWPHSAMYSMVSISGSTTQKNVINNGLQSVIDQWKWK